MPRVGAACGISDALHQYLVTMRFAVMMNDEPALIRMIRNR